LQQVLEASKTDEDATLPSLLEAITLTRMVVEHLASLPPPTSVANACAAPVGVQGIGGASSTLRSAPLALT
jgi:hypothetical protein